MNDKHRGADPYADLAKRTSGNRPKTGLIVIGISVGAVVLIAVLALLFTGGSDEPVADGTGAAAAFGLKDAILRRRILMLRIGASGKPRKAPAAWARSRISTSSIVTPSMMGVPASAGAGRRDCTQVSWPSGSQW